MRGVAHVDSFLHPLVDFLHGDVAHGEYVDVLDFRLQDVRHRFPEAVPGTLIVHVRGDKPFSSHTWGGKRGDMIDRALNL